jgi:hypothetical protein
MQPNTPEALVDVDTEGLDKEDVRVPATPYLVPLFTLIYLVLLHLLLPSHLDVPCYLNNRQRYCSVWPEKDWTLFTEDELDERLWEDSDSEDEESDCKQLQVLIGWILKGVKE